MRGGWRQLTFVQVQVEAQVLASNDENAQAKPLRTSKGDQPPRQEAPELVPPLPIQRALRPMPGYKKSAP